MVRRFLCACALVLAPLAHAQSLRLGDTAPELRVSRWLRAEPIRGFEHGKVYVVELNGTWSPTFPGTMVFLSDLQTRYKDRGVSVVGVCVRESGRHAAETFLAGSPVEACYAIAADDVPPPPMGTPDNRAWAERGAMSVNWLKAAGRSAVPTAFIIDREGRIAWIGNTLAPRGELEAALTRVLSEGLTPEQSLALSLEYQARDQREKETDARWRRELADGKPRDALAIIDQLIALDPAYWLPERTPDKFNILLTQAGDAAGARALAVSALEGALNDAWKPLHEMAWTLLTAPAIPDRDLDLALRLAARADELTQHQQPDVLDTLAQAWFAKGDFDKAIALQTSVVAIQRRAVEAAPGKEPPTRLLQAFEATLKRYQDAKAKGGG